MEPFVVTSMKQVQCATEMGVVLPICRTHPGTVNEKDESNGIVYELAMMQLSHFSVHGVSIVMCVWISSDFAIFPQAMEHLIS